MQIVAVPVFGIIIHLFLQCIEANLTLDFKVTKISANHKSANCNVANTTYSHGETFKLDCKTQCVCENGRHACSSMCPKEQLPAPEDTISCRSPRLVEVPGHCCKMWLCENPTADVYATCHNSSTSPWTPCSRKCGLGLSTRSTTTTAGCNQLSNLRLCENRKCETQQQDNTDDDEQSRQHQENNLQPQEPENKEEKINQKYFRKTNKQLKHKLKRQHHLEKQRLKRRQPTQQEHSESEHRIRKGHECRSLQRLGPARVRLGRCVSKKLYRPKICGRCHQNTKCCVPSVSTTIQVELFCPLNAMDPISFVQQQLKTEQHHGQLIYPKTTTTTTSSSSADSSASSSPASLTTLWDTQSLDAIDQEYLQSHQIQIANKFIAVEWILKCECTENDNCQRIVNTTSTIAKDYKGHNSGSASRGSSSHTSTSNSNIDININNRKYHDYDDNENTETGNNLNNNKNMQKINYLKLNKNNYNKIKKNSMFYKDYKQHKLPKTETKRTQIDKIPDDSKNVDEQNDKLQKDVYGNEDNEQNDSNININNVYGNSKRNTYIHSNSFNRRKQARDYVGKNKHGNGNGNSNNNSSNKNKNQRNKQSDVGADDDDDNDGDKDEEIVNENGEENERSTSLLSAASVSASSSLLSLTAEDVVGGAASSSDEIQPDIIPYPPPPFSANRHTTNNRHNTSNSSNNNSGINNFNSNSNGSNENTKNSYKNTHINWIKEKFKLKRSKQSKQQQQQQKQQKQKEQQENEQQFYENWLLQQQYNNNRPYNSDIEAT